MIKPLGDRVVIRQTEAEEITAGGIVIPDTAQEKPCQGEVVAVGENRWSENGDLIPMSVKVGDKVLVVRYAGHLVGVGGEELIIVKEEEILAVI